MQRLLALEIPKISNRRKNRPKAVADDEDVSGASQSRIDVARGYLSLIFWLLADLFAHYRWRSLLLALLGALQVGSRYAAMGVLYAFLDHFEKEKVAVVLGVSLPQPDTVAFLALGLAAGGGLLMISAYFRYSLSISALYIGKAYEVFCLRRLFSLAACLPHPKAPEASQKFADGTIVRYRRYAKQAGRLAWRLGQLIPSIASIFIATGILIWLNPLLTAGLALLALLVTAGQYPANRKAAKASQGLEDWNPEANKEFKRVIETIQVSPVPVQLSSPALKPFFDSQTIRKSMKNHVNRIKALQQATFASEVGGTILLIGSIFALGLGILEGELSFAHAFVYVAVMRYMIKDFVRISRGFVIVNRFHAGLRRYIGFVRSVPASIVHHREYVRPEPGDLSLDCTHLDQAGEEALTVPLGENLALLFPSRSARPVSIVLTEAMESEAKLEETPPFMVQAQLLVPNSSLRFNLGLPDRVDAARVVELLKSFGYGDEELEWCTPKILEKTPSTPWSETLSEEMILALNALGAHLRGHRLVLIAAANLKERSAEWRHGLFSLFSDVHLIAVYDDPRSLGLLDEPKVLISDGTGLIAWIEAPSSDEERERLIRVYEALVKKDRLAAGGDDDDDDELDMDM